jgi:uncharacterized membrane protein
MHEVLDGLRGQLHVSGHWMAWNLVLALAPWALAVALFRRCGASHPIPL